MRQKNIFAFLTFLLLTLSSCTPSKFTPEEVNFPLAKSHSILLQNQVVKKIGASQSLVVFQTLEGGLQAIELSTNKSVWAIKDFQTKTTDPDILFLDDTTVLMSDTKLLLVNNLGQKTFVNLNPKRYENMMLVAAYEKYVYIIRGGNWHLEVYDISANKMVWDVPAGRGILKVFYDSVIDTVYVITTSSVEAYSNSTGALLWKTEISADQSTYANGVIYFTNVVNFPKEYVVTALDANSHKVLWSKEFPYDISLYMYGLNVFDNVLVMNADSELFAFDITSGDFKWETYTHDSNLYTSPVLLDEVFYVKNSNKIVYAISPKDGSIIGYVQLEPGSLTGGQPTYEAISGVFLFQNGIVFKTKNSIEYYTPK